MPRGRVDIYLHINAFCVNTSALVKIDHKPGQNMDATTSRIPKSLKKHLDILDFSEVLEAYYSDSMYAMTSYIREKAKDMTITSENRANAILPLEIWQTILWQNMSTDDIIRLAGTCRALYYMWWANKLHGRYFNMHAFTSDYSTVSFDGEYYDIMTVGWETYRVRFRKASDLVVNDEFYEKIVDESIFLMVSTEDIIFASPNLTLFNHKYCRSCLKFSVFNASKIRRECNRCCLGYKGPLMIEMNDVYVPCTREILEKLNIEADYIEDILP